MNSKFAHIILFALLLSSAPSIATASNSNKAAAFFYRIGEWVDNFQLRGLDTTYITLPEHSWRVALTTGGTGIHDNYTTWVDPATPVSLISRTTPSLGLGFNVGVRFGAGKKRVREVLGEPVTHNPSPVTPKTSKMPQWVTDYFFSSMQ